MYNFETDVGFAPSEDPLMPLIEHHFSEFSSLLRVAMLITVANLSFGQLLTASAVSNGGEGLLDWSVPNAMLGDTQASSTWISKAEGFKGATLARFRTTSYTNVLVVKGIATAYHFIFLLATTTSPTSKTTNHHCRIPAEVKPKVEVVTYHCETCGSEIFQSVDAWLRR